MFQNQLAVPLQQDYPDSSPDASPRQSPLPHSSSSAHLQSASKLILSSQLVYSQRLELPAGVEVIRATPSAGRPHRWLTCHTPLQVRHTGGSHTTFFCR